MEDYVSFEIAQKLKENWFREKCKLHYYDDTKDRYASSNPQCYNYGGNTSDAPTISHVLKWLRNEKKIHLCIDIYDDGWFFDISSFCKQDSGVYEVELPYKSSNVTPDYETYEQAALAGIEYILDYLI